MSQIIQVKSNKPSNLKAVVQCNDGRQYMVSTVSMKFPLGQNGFESSVFSFDRRTGKVSNWSDRFSASASDAKQAYENHKVLCNRLEDVLAARVFL